MFGNFSLGCLGARAAVDPNIDPHWSDVVLLCGFDDVDGSTNIVDESSYARTLTRFGTPVISTAQSKFGGSSVLFDGNNDAVRAADAANLAIGSAQFTIEAWVRQASGGAAPYQIIGQRADGGTGTSSNNGWSLSIGSGTRTITFAYWDTSGVRHAVTTSGAITLDTWYHIAADRDGSGVVRVYIDGVMQGSGTFTGGDAAVRDVTTFLAMGLSDGSTSDYAGYMDEVRVTIGTARYASDGGFAVPTSAYPRAG